MGTIFLCTKKSKQLVQNYRPVPLISISKKIFGNLLFHNNLWGFR